MFCDWSNSLKFKGYTSAGTIINVKVFMILYSKFFEIARKKSHWIYPLYLEESSLFLPTLCIFWLLVGSLEFHCLGLVWWLSGKESACNARVASQIPGLGIYYREGNGNSLLYSCLGDPMDRGAWWAIVHGVTRVRQNLGD